ncbi:pyrimidodiazepine synthase [Plodia interpunctella]|uniref:pyrimidodiazepine synthase n=1 Tax=Plodia interpunctella TaxID=58824 RepID=UPI002368F231|nr:pyrimidodiazepine synthase-like [Plodia interpunctella]
MITSTLTFAVHVIMSSFRVLAPVARLLENAFPVRNMASKAVKGKVNFNSKHLRRGDPMPPYTGKLRVYNMRYCPYAQRTLLALIAKDIDFEVVNIHLMDKPEWFLARSAFGKVPALEVADGVTIYESLVTVEYLDDAYPQRPLLPKDPVTKAYDKIIIEATGPIHGLFYRILRTPESVTNEHVEAYHKALKFIEDQIKARGNKFLGGSKPGYADYMVWPWFERIINSDLDGRLKIDGQKFKVLSEYINHMLQDPVVSQYIVPKEIMSQFIIPYRSGDFANINYDIMIEE